MSVLLLALGGIWGLTRLSQRPPPETFRLPPGMITLERVEPVEPVNLVES